MRAWIRRYLHTGTSSADDEQQLVVRAPITLPVQPDVAHFSADAPVRLGRTSRRVLQHKFGRSDLVKLLAVLEQLDLLVSRVAGTFPVSIYVHANLYHKTEMAHTPTFPPDTTRVHRLLNSYISFNISEPRLRMLLLGVTYRDATARAALTDLYVHEKAHQVQEKWQPAGTPTVHDAEFYSIKSRLKRLLLDALNANKNRDPYRRVRYDSRLATAEEIADALNGIATRAPPSNEHYRRHR